MVEIKIKDEDIPQQYKKSKWERFIPKCSICGSKRVKRLNLFKNTFLKGEAEMEKYKCKNCKAEFWL